jgi:multiple sugar transport system substrate-binding protein
MMSKIEFSLTPTAAMGQHSLEELLQEFKAKSGIAVELREIETKSIRQELHKFIINQQGPDVSQLGSTWLRGMVDMNVLRPFKTQEIKSIGSPADFIPASWESTEVREGQYWAVPWLADIRLLYYRRDLLEQAGIDEKTAFTTPAALENTLTQLQASGVENPWVIPTQFAWQTLHNIASWLWGTGNTFLNSAGTKVIFNQPEASEGIKAYYRLSHFLTPETSHLTSDQSEALFLNGNAAVTLSRYCLSIIPLEMREKVGIAAPPGIPFIGGSHLVIMKYSRRDQEAFEFIRFMTGTEAQLSSSTGHLIPTRLEALDALQFPTEFQESFTQILKDVLEAGRSFRPAHLWDVIETRLVSMLAAIWEDILSSQNPDIDRIVDSHIQFLTTRLNITLGN